MFTKNCKRNNIVEKRIMSEKIIPPPLKFKGNILERQELHSTGVIRLYGI